MGKWLTISSDDDFLLDLQREDYLLDIIYTYKISRKILQNERISNDNLYLLD